MVRQVLGWRVTEYVPGEEVTVTDFGPEQRDQARELFVAKVRHRPNAGSDVAFEPIFPPPTNKGVL
jgi:hypothetical protein